MTKGKALVERKWTSSAQTKRLAVDCIMPSLKSRVSASPQDVFLSVMDRLKLVLPMTALSELEFVHPRQHPLAYASKTFSVSAQLCCRCRTRERACSDDDRGTSEAARLYILSGSIRVWIDSRISLPLIFAEICAASAAIMAGLYQQGVEERGQ